MLHLVKVALNLPGGRLDLHEFAHHHVKEDRDRGFPEFYKIKGKQLNVRHHHVKEDRNHGFLEFDENQWQTVKYQRNVLTASKHDGIIVTF